MVIFFGACYFSNYNNFGVCKKKKTVLDYVSGVIGSSKFYVQSKILSTILYCNGNFDNLLDWEPFIVYLKKK